jgi:hypothetical protein
MAAVRNPYMAGEVGAGLVCVVWSLVLESIIPQ